MKAKCCFTSKTAVFFIRPIADLILLDVHGTLKTVEVEVVVVEQDVVECKVVVEVECEVFVVVFGVVVEDGVMEV